MKCPNCEELLVMTERQAIEIDYCPKCRGVWLDKGELDKIIEKSTAAESSQQLKSQDEKRNRGNDNRNNPNRRKGGFLGNLFDFD